MGGPGVGMGMGMGMGGKAPVGIMKGAGKGPPTMVPPLNQAGGFGAHGMPGMMPGMPGQMGGGKQPKFYSRYNRSQDQVHRCSQHNSRHNSCFKQQKRYSKELKEFRILARVDPLARSWCLACKGQLASEGWASDLYSLCNLGLDHMKQLLN